MNPVTGEVEDKYFWLVEHDGLLFGSGWHHDESEMQWRDTRPAGPMTERPDPRPGTGVGASGGLMNLLRGGSPPPGSISRVTSLATRRRMPAQPQAFPPE